MTELQVFKEFMTFRIQTHSVHIFIIMQPIFVSKYMFLFFLLLFTHLSVSNNPGPSAIIITIGPVYMLMHKVWNVICHWPQHIYDMRFRM